MVIVPELEGQGFDKLLMPCIQLACPTFRFIGSEGEKQEARSVKAGSSRMSIHYPHF